MKLSEIATQLGAQFTGSDDPEISTIGGIEDAQPGAITFLANPRYESALAESKASAVLAKAPIESAPMPVLVVENPSMCFSQITTLLGLVRPMPQAGVNDKAEVHDSAKLGAGVSVGAFSYIGENVTIGENTILHPHVYVGPNTTIGNDCIVYPQVSILDGTEIDDHVIINSGSVIGCDGFGFDIESPNNEKIPQVGTVHIESDVEIGANVTIDRARFSKTIIGKGTKVDNLVQIAHNVKTGENCVIVSQVGLAGSCELGNRVVIAAQSGVAGHIKVGDNIIGAGRTGFTKTTEKPGIYAGFPAKDAGAWRKEIALVGKLDKIRDQIKTLEKRLAELET